MANLSYPSSEELQLQLDAQEGAILDVVRGCPWWTKADIERHLPENAAVTRVTLTAMRSMDSTLRRILNLSFGLTFPLDGGVGEKRGRVISGAAKAKRVR